MDMWLQSISRTFVAEVCRGKTQGDTPSRALGPDLWRLLGYYIRVFSEQGWCYLVFGSE